MIGTHNSMTYLKPKKWYMYLFQFMARCQNKTIQEQYDTYEVRLFDLRINFDKQFHPEFRHGLMRYKGEVYQILDYLNSRKEKVYVRLILEKNNSKDGIKEVLFKNFCKKIENKYKNIYFFAGNRKSDWKIIYEFKNSDIPLTQMVSSMTWKKWDDWFPWIYAKLMNKKNIEKYKDKNLLIDFI